MNQWIDVKEQLPQLGLEVLATDGKRIWTADVDIVYKYDFMNIDPPESILGWCESRYDGNELHAITHWMYLPELPINEPQTHQDQS